MTDSKRVAFLGGGNMAEAIIKGLLREDSPTALMVAEISVERRTHLAKTYPGIRVVESSAQAADWGDVVILAVKPQQATSVLTTIRQAIGPDKLVVSIMAGVRSASIEDALESGARVVRVMPNTPALVGCGATAICAGRNADGADLDCVETVFAQTGLVVRVDEKQMDAVTGLSGSGPAYVFTFVEALSDAGVKNGLARDVASKLALQTVLGAARLLAETGEHPAKLREQVTSPGGTTIAGLHVLENGKFRGTIMDAVDAASKRSKELAGN
ncbi:MAG: pyrroline-5-carboxylate reductase [Desulfobacteraceae bacterium]|nr:pyrroline-5-carboxylate reductase [Desulfobacteraceae bacterium]